MNKALIVSIQSKWLEMILNGKKKFEFRNWKVDKGTVIYFYCTKAKPYLIEHPYHSYMLIDDKGFDSLNGKVVARAVVKEVWEPVESLATDNLVLYNIKDYDESKVLSEEEAKSQGYTNQRYAIELEQVEAIEPREISHYGLKHAPQSRVWVLEEQNGLD